jgi:hypothetical protein
MPDEALSEDARAIRVELAAGMTAEQISGVEGPALDEYAVQVSRARDARSRIDLEGLIVADAKGNPIPHPALKIELEAQREIRLWVTRYRPAVIAGAVDDDLDRELSRLE